MRLTNADGHRAAALFAAELAQEAGALAATYGVANLAIEQKPDDSPVTAADKACERLIMERIAAAYPHDGFLGEEGGRRDGPSGRRWIIDPIDGTRDFIRGMPFWAVLIALEEEGEIVAGAATCPGQKLLLHASKSGGAWSGERRLTVTDRHERSKSVLSINGFHKGGMARITPAVFEWARGFWAVRSLGGALDALMVALDHADVWIEPSAEPWDLAPFQLILREAGCSFGSFEGRNSIYDGTAWACKPGLETDVRALLGLPRI